MNTFGAIAAIILLTVLYFNFHIVTGMKDQAVKPFKQWQKGDQSNPLFIVDKKDVPKPVSRGDKPAEKTIGTEPGTLPEGAEKFPEGGKTLDDPEQKLSKEQQNNAKVRHTDYGFGARAVGVQKARDL